MSGIPGPSSANVSRSPCRPAVSSTSSRKLPPPPWANAFRASSLAAVTSLVWSTIEKPSATEASRTAWRTRTTSSAARISSASAETSDTGSRASLRACSEELHALLDVERGADVRKLETELDERDRDRRPHPDDDGLGVEHARHRGRVGEHPADERVDDLERRDVD